VCIGVDITTRKEAGELAIKEKSARETAKLRSIFLANVSHELRTPLNGILGLAELVLHSTSPSLDPQHLTYVDSIHSSALSLLTIINQILDFSRIDSGRMDLECIPFNVKALVYEQVNIIKPLLQMQKKADRVQLMIDIADNVPDNFEGDPTRIAQVLLNLLSNAVKFTDKGSVSVKLQKVLPPVKSGSTSPLVSKSISEESMLGAGSEGRKIHSIQFSVTDSGIGISKEVQRILFEPFTQATPSTKRRYGGTGLGLSICDKLVNLMNGKLDVESDEGKGATFWFQIPLIEHPYHLSEERYAHLKEKFNANFTPNMTPEKPIAQEKPNTSKPNSLSFSSNLQGITGRLLVAEDHPVNRMLLVALLNKLGHQVTAVENGNQVVTEFVRSKTAGEKPYDLILMDCQMPEVDGYQATRFIREKEQELSASRRRNSLGVSPDTHSPLLQALAKNSMPYWKDRVPIIAITANAIETNQDKCYEAGMDDFVTKPITLQKVAQLIEKWLKEKHEVEKEKNLS
jgi:signal transduction histidine kinase/DNA-binding NarL/FixJ family response regulator